MIKVRCVSNWSPSYPLHMRIINQFCPDYNEIDREINFVDDDSYDFLVAFNSKEGIEFAEERTLGFIQEPPDHDFFDRNLVNKCYSVYTCAAPEVGLYAEKEDCYVNIIGREAAMFYYMEGAVTQYLNNSSFDKPKKLSFVMSANRGGFYEERHKALHKILDSDLNCDIYGYGLAIKDKRYKGAPEDKAAALLPYEYSIAIENGIWEGYISDKYIDPLLCNTVPIYLGAPDIKNHFQTGITLPPIDDNFIEALTHIIEYPAAEHAWGLTLDKMKWHKEHNIYNLIKDFCVNG